MRKHFPRPLLLVLAGLLLLNLLQASLTELLYDEAYYWYYALQPAWGYFDHPPMTAWMIWAGYQLLGGELGVRLLSVLMSIGTYLLLWSLIQGPERDKRPWPIIVWLLSIVLLHAYGFLSLPDTPLLFFAALFLWVYRAFLRTPGAKWAFLLALAMAGLMYSKYHAALVILFTLASNPALFRNKWAWLAVGVSLLAYTPHLYWLYEQDFVSVRYHLFERPNQPYNFGKFTGGYLLNLVALFGLTFPWVYASLFRFSAKDQFQRALKFIAWGVLLFFLLSSFQRRVQTQWLIVACIPIAVIVGNRLAQSPGWGKWLIRAAVANLIVLGYLRIGLVHAPLFPVHFETHGNKAWVERLEQTASGAAVVFENSYRQAAMYGFYSGKPSFSLNNAYYRKNQYSIDDSEAGMQGKRVFFVPKVNRKSAHGYLNDQGEMRYGYFIDAFTSYRKLKAGLTPEPNPTPGQVHTFWLTNPYAQPIVLDSLRFGLATLDAHKNLIRVVPITPEMPLEAAILPQGDTLHFTFRMPAFKAPEPEYLRAVVRTRPLLWGLNGMPQKLER